jgi:hypothetical protein
MSEFRTADQVKNTLIELRELLDQIAPGTPVKLRGSLSFAELGMRVIYGAPDSGCLVCQGCSGCDGCKGCENTSRKMMPLGVDVINPEPMSVG